MTEDQMTDLFENKAAKSEGYAIAYALMCCSGSIRSCATWLKFLGTGDAATTMGALEHLAVQIKEGAELIASSLENRIDG